MYSTGINSPVTMTIAADGGSYNANEPNWGNTSAFTTAGSPYSNLMQDLIYANKCGHHHVERSCGKCKPTIWFSITRATKMSALAVQALSRSTVSPRPVYGTALPAHWSQGLAMLILRQPCPMVRGTWLLHLDRAVAGGVVPSEGDLDGFQLVAVPEPGTLAMLALAGMGLFGLRRRLA